MTFDELATLAQSLCDALNSNFERIIALRDDDASERIENALLSLELALFDEARDRDDDDDIRRASVIAVALAL